MTITQNTQTPRCEGSKEPALAGSIRNGFGECATCGAWKIVNQKGLVRSHPDRAAARARKLEEAS